MSKQRTLTDDRLDRIYMRAMRCPYCQTKIEKGAASCPTCGISKAQIYRANLVVHQKHTPQVVLYSKIRPANIPFWKMGLGGMFGFLGIHCFVAKRYWRGLLILSCTLLFFILGLIFNNEYTNYAGEVVAAHPWRAEFEDHGWPFPPDMLILVSAVLWIWDWSSILLGNFKYPVVVSEDPNAA